MSKKNRDIDEMFHIAAIELEIVADIFHDGLGLNFDIQLPGAID